jgi:hypothetical protein
MKDQTLSVLFDQDPAKDEPRPHILASVYLGIIVGSTDEGNLRRYVVG